MDCIKKFLALYYSGKKDQTYNIETANVRLRVQTHPENEENLGFGLCVEQFAF